MLLKELLKNVEVLGSISEDVLNIDISSLTLNSNECKDGSLFFAIRGENNDGANYLSDAEAGGARCVVSDRECKCSIPCIVTTNVRASMAKIASNFYYNSHEELKIIGVTGTNGKTTTVNMISRVLKAYGKRVCTIGTLGAYVQDVKISETLTTPDPIELHRLFEIAKLSGVEYVVMEVSAHALYYDKLCGVKFEVVALTNFTQDHLDFFGTMQAYQSAKERLFSPDFSQFQVLNADDDMGIKLLNSTEVPYATYGIYNPSDVFAIDYETRSGIKCIVNCFDDVFELSTPFSGDFNLYNVLTAVTVLRLLSVPTEQIISSFLRMEEVPGRFNILGKQKRVIIDYAHTPDGLKNLLESARKLTDGRLILVFGCGGNRDSKKRSIMGRIAASLADFTVITSDNPRYEEPLNIISEIERGHKEISSSYITIIERSHAVNYAVSTAESRDLVVIAGKGAEEYLEIKGERRPYSDRTEVLEVLKSLNYE
ncbi:MAG: UDP-N-acetylmuramoyl-L-alanyl-D-glutamate--2,6-diaminopimelate ligase [Clostridia bacterium]|nr:UDP-N-acetylmuramoyl-L-alanyl-D-glutamate--2,6-diaminopimelate ligase [Clostridia bacterium]